MYRYIYHTWMVREQLFRVPGCFFLWRMISFERSCQQPVATCRMVGRIKSARFRTDLLVGSKHSFERTNLTGASAVKKCSPFFQDRFQALKRRHESDTMLCPAGFDFPTKTSRVLHFLDSSAVCGCFCFFLNTYMNVWWYCWKKSG